MRRMNCLFSVYLSLSVCLYLSKVIHIDLYQFIHHGVFLFSLSDFLYTTYAECNNPNNDLVDVYATTPTAS